MSCAASDALVAHLIPPVRILPNSRVMKQKQHEDKTLQDDRARLELDAHDDSPLVEGEGAPLADDAVATQATGKDAVVTQSLLGGAAIAINVPDSGNSTARDPMVARDDKPIND
jgi:hypothetical protein